MRYRMRYHAKMIKGLSQADLPVAVGAVAPPVALFPFIPNQIVFVLYGPHQSLGYDVQGLPKTET